MQRGKKKKLSPSAAIAYTAMMTALLIGGQVALGFVAGIEVVTVLLLTFSYCFGIWCGVYAAIAFSLLRCFIWGFYPSVILLYLVYYPLFAALFGLLGKIRSEIYDRAPVWLAVVINVILLSITATCVSCAVLNLIKVSRLYKKTVTVLLYVIAGLCAGLDLAFNVLYILRKCNVTKTGTYLRLFFLTAIASVCTICFSLLDDVISPWILGMQAQAALTYFYASFLAMLPQTVCTIVTVTTLFYPLAAVMQRPAHTKII